ncbi:MAG: phosphate signaling complex protein PhoU [Nitrosomonas sp.]|nr:phosphate signaling complex protein PhoU [Nitrosomonas sp.]MCW5608638.1 phosphate signaling complex protein PhoU [Nitrosomonas sp.]
MVTRLEGHAFRRFDGALVYLHTEVLAMAGLVLEQIQLALESFRTQDQEILDSVCRKEYQVDGLEKKIDSAITQILAREGPVAFDLRAVMAFSKAVTDLERLGDEAVRIAQLSAKICSGESGFSNTHMLRDIGIMGDHACSLLTEAIEILETLDLDRARELLVRSDLGKEFCTSFRILTSYVLEDTRNMRYIVNVVMVLKSLERIGDHARNLAEYVVYIVSGHDIRHRENDEK